MKSLAEALQNFPTTRPNPRDEFVEEAYIKINENRGKYKELSKKRIALMINTVCPSGKYNFVYDYRKSCQEAKNYGKAFWGIYKRCANVGKQ